MAQVQLSNPGNSRHQLGRLLAVDSRQVAFEARIGKKIFLNFFFGGDHLPGCYLGYV